MVEPDVDNLVSRIETDGYAILEDAIDPALIDVLLDDLARIEAKLGTKPGDNSFEGEQTTRVYNLLRHGGAWLDLPVHPVVLPVAESVLGGEILVSTVSSIAIAPGETPQPIHADDQVLPLARPHVPTVCNSMWALTDFTEANGATRIVPGSHMRDHAPDFGSQYDSIAAEMTRGSILIWTGSLWHAGGANDTDQIRIGIAMNYCAGWIRQQENQQLGIPPDVMAGFSPKLRELCGLGIYRGLIGHVEKDTPAHRLYGDDHNVPHLFDSANP
ncbi:MAG: phytanoyl-CoA dioxygenase family protein [Acidobacteria bacterium]|nr:phytanoyl-CoA dioxygenase family protein [Acidobacteriota bacterium]